MLEQRLGRARRDDSLAGGAPARLTGLIQMLAACLQGGKNHQVRIREKQLFRLRFRRFRYTDKFAEMLIVGEVPEVIEADPG